MLAQDGIVWDNTGQYGCQRETHPQIRGKTGRNARFWSKSSEKSGQRVCKPGSVHSSEEKAVIIHLGCPLPNTSCNLPGRRPGNGAICRLYLVLLPTGFTLPCPLPATRCALTAPFHPYLPHKYGAGGLLSVALSLESPPPDVIRRRVSVEPGLSSPAACRNKMRRRLPDPLTEN